MSSTIGGEDINHDLTTDEKDKLERDLRAEARKLMLKGKKKKRKSLLNQANEISRRKSKRADHH
ncbi:Uncharacterized protein dnl_36450 [Desulfonema limicola]|uniref:Uncharacterized protein n=1 Tax=Desulfonema limicola TaxID=45656 RepID=A0A975GHF3_9BACT|nr:hypothetical protein [Desulfonema limicola]QTA81312.1 Uncharacterized protein dnl_36450 [Desulfonema limicola]